MRLAVFGLLVVIAAAGIIHLAATGDISAFADPAAPAALDFDSTGASGTTGP